MQTRTCEFLSVPQHTQDTQCPTLDNPPSTSQTCEEIITVEPQQPTANISNESPQATLEIRINISQAYKKVKVGDELKFQATLLAINMQTKRNVSINYYIKNSKDKIAYQESETLSIDKETSFTKAFKLSQDLVPGPYVLTAEIKCVKGFAASSDAFSIVKRAKSAFSMFTANAAYTLKPGFAKIIANTVTISLFLAMLVMLSVIPLIYLVRTHKPSSQIPQGLNKYETELYKYVAKALEHGLGEEEINQALLKTGWKKETVDKVINLTIKK